MIENIAYTQCDCSHCAPIHAAIAARMAAELAENEATDAYWRARTHQYGGWLARIASGDLPIFSPGYISNAYLPKRTA